LTKEGLQLTTGLLEAFPTFTDRQKTVNGGNFRDLKNIAVSVSLLFSLYLSVCTTVYEPIFSVKKNTKLAHYWHKTKPHS
jgi:hypothetical protein